MMTLHEMFHASAQASADGRKADAHNWALLALLIGESEARARLRTWRDPDQQDYAEYIEEMSLGGRTYRMPR